jgi:Fe2+ or Zn2+ uptake regulation protein
LSNSIDRLIALLKADTLGEDLANLLNELLVDDRKRDVLLVKLDEVRKEMSTMRSELKFTKSEEVLRSIVLNSKKPLSAQDVASSVGDEFRSLKYVNRTSVVLNSLVGKGAIGRFKLGYNYYFTSPKEAINEQLKKRGETPDDSDWAEIAKETGMPLGTVRDAIKELTT